MTVNENSKPLLTVKGLKQYFKVSNNYTVHAVENVSFQIYPGETYGLVGESGSGKSTIGRSIIRLYDPTAGEINFNGMDISVICEFERLNDYFTVGRNRSGEMIKFGNINAYVNFHEVVPPFPKV